MSKIAHLVAILGLAMPAVAQTTSSILVDLGTTGFPTQGTVPETWNDFTQTAESLALIDSAGQATGIQWTVLAGFAGSNSAGTATPTTGSPLAAFPVSVTRDVMYGSGNDVVIEFDGWGPNTLVDMTFAASRTNVGDDRTTSYLVEGFNSGGTELNPSNNTENTASVSGILADSSGKIRLTLRAAPSNNNVGTHYFYLGGIRIDATTFPTRPQVLGFDLPGVAATLVEGAGTLSTNVAVIESTGATPAVSVAVVDDATGLPPTWLSYPSATVAGSPMVLTFDEAPVVEGSYSAVLTASASGYADTDLNITFTVRRFGSRNLLFYGNSYTIGNQGMAPLVGYIAEAAGHPSPNVVARLVGGQNLQYHLTNPTQAAAITTALPLGEQWDTVVMQGFSLEATNAFGDPAQFRANAVAIHANVDAHSPGAKAVMFQTWARGPGHSAYPGTYSGPLAMHDEIRTNYRAAVADINAAVGAGTAFNAAAGDVMALLAFDPSFYTADLSHPTAATTLFTAMTVYQAIYRELVCDVDPGFGSGNNLVTRIASMGLSESDWVELAGYAERVADRSLRRLPGSGEDLLLKTGVNATPRACPVETAGVGDQLQVEMTSPNGLYTSGAFLLLDAFATGAHPGPLLPWVEIQFNPAVALVVASAPHANTPLNYSLTLPTSFPGASLLLQGFAVGASAETGNPLFTTTDAHELILQ